MKILLNPDFAIEFVTVVLLLVIEELFKNFESFLQGDKSKNFSLLINSMKSANVMKSIAKIGFKYLGIGVSG